jgi:hypothetical protein
MVVSTAFVVGPAQRHRFQSHLHSDAAIVVDELTKPEQKVCKLMDQLHESKYAFRIVVMGNGAILETTSPLGPIKKLSQSPTTSETILTLASSDQSFEFHVKTATVSKIVITEKESPLNNKMMRILRFLCSDGNAMCSLIMQDDSEAAIEWFEALREEYGEDVQL